MSIRSASKTIQPADDSKQVPSPGHEPLVLIAIAVGIGCGIDHVFLISPPITVVVGSISLGGWLIAWSRRAEGAAQVLLLIALGSLSAAYHGRHLRIFQANDIGHAAEDHSHPVVLEGIRCSSVQTMVATEPLAWSSLPATSRHRFLMRVTRIRRGRTWRQVSGKITVTVNGSESERPRLTSLHGIRIWGQIRQPSISLNPGSRSSREYWLRRRIRAQLIIAGIDSIERIAVSATPLDRLRRWGGRLREKCRTRLLSQLPDRQSGLGVALIFGDRGLMEDSAEESFRRTGTAHLLAVSGLHLAMALGWLWWFDRIGWIPRRWLPWLAIGCALSYAMFAGGKPPVWRAGLFIAILCVARVAGRFSSPRQLLAAAALVLWIFNPTAWWEAGVQLSFVAVAGLAWWQESRGGNSVTDPLDTVIFKARPVWQRWLFRATRHLLMLFTTSATVVAITTPLVWYHFHMIAWPGVLIGPVLAGVVAMALWSGLLLLITSAASFEVTTVWLGVLCRLSLSAAESIVLWADRISPPFSLATPPSWCTALVYFVLAFLWIRFRGSMRRKWCFSVLALFFICSITVNSIIQRRSADLQCVFLSVGHGTCVLIRTPDGQDWLYDAGSTGEPRAAARRIFRALRTFGVNKLNGVIVSHADADHYNLLPQLANRMPIDVILMPTAMSQDGNPGLNAWFAALADSGVPWRTLVEADLLPFGGVRAIVRHPPPGFTTRFDNESSIVIQLDFEGHQILLPGDLEGRGLDLFWRRWSEDPTVRRSTLMAPHHGSIHSVPSHWIQRTSPNVVVISGSHRNAVSTTVSWSQQGNQRVLHTSQGAIRLRIQRHAYRLEQWDGTFAKWRELIVDMESVERFSH